MPQNQATAINGSGNGHYALASRCDLPAEQALIAAAQAGTTEAMDELLLRHKTALYRAARRFTRNHEDAEDLVQDAMLRAFVNVRKFRKESLFATWLIAIVNNAALSMKRKGRNVCLESLESRHEGAGGPRWDIPDVRRNPEEEAMRQELLGFLHRALLRQSRTHRIIVKRRLFDQASFDEAASSLGVTVASAKSSLFRARRRLSESFERRGLVQRRKQLTLPGNEITLKSEQL